MSPKGIRQKCHVTHTDKRLHSLHRKLQHEGVTEEYDVIIKEQLAEGVIERAPLVSQSKEF